MSTIRKLIPLSVFLLASVASAHQLMTCTAECAAVVDGIPTSFGSITATSERSSIDAFNELRFKCRTSVGTDQVVLAKKFTYTTTECRKHRKVEIEFARPQDPTVCKPVKIDTSIPPVYNGPVGPLG